MLVRGEPAVSPSVDTAFLMTGSDFSSLSKLSLPNTVGFTHKRATLAEFLLKTLQVRMIMKPQFHDLNLH